MSSTSTPIFGRKKTDGRGGEEIQRKINNNLGGDQGLF
jgi:hypothetical protein